MSVVKTSMKKKFSLSIWQQLQKSPNAGTQSISEAWKVVKSIDISPPCSSGWVKITWSQSNLGVSIIFSLEQSQQKYYFHL